MNFNKNKSVVVNTGLTCSRNTWKLTPLGKGSKKWYLSLLGGVNEGQFSLFIFFWSLANIKCVATNNMHDPAVILRGMTSICSNVYDI